MTSKEATDTHDVETDDPTAGVLLAELAGEGRVKLDEEPSYETVHVESGTVIGYYEGVPIRVSGRHHTTLLDGREATESWPPNDGSVECAEYVEIWRTTTERGVFDVAHVIDKTDESGAVSGYEDWTEFVNVEAIDESDDAGGDPESDVSATAE